MRTTIDLDSAILRELKQRAAEEHKTIGQLASELLAAALKPGAEPEEPEFVWHTTDSEMLVDIEDKDAVWKILDGR